MTAIRHVLRDVAAQQYEVPAWVVAGLETALDDALARYGATVDGEKRGGDR